MNFSKAYNRTEFVKFLKTSFLPDDFLEEETNIELQTQTQYTQKVTKIGACDSLDLVVYEIKHNSENDARVSLSKEAFRLLSDEFEDKALVLFLPESDPSHYRFSLITIDLDIDSKGNLIKEYSNPRRYSYFLGENIPTYTPHKYLVAKGRVKDAKDLQDRFSVEVLTKEFYNELSDWFAWALTVINFPYNINNSIVDRSSNITTKQNTESTIRLITRIIFVWFLKQKKLIPNEFFDETFLSNKLLNEFQPNSLGSLFEKGETTSNYYKAILQNLFFAMLNSPITPEGEDTISERHFRNSTGDYDNNKLMRYQNLFKNPQLFIDLANNTVPFLNGGLFDCLDDKDNDYYVDGFSDRETVQKRLSVPDYLFFGEKANLDLSHFYGEDEKSKKSVHVNGLIHILKKYNFTVEENTPFDQEVSLDPELLGKVFENLLASYNPETKTTARKQTGSFYTPREIVQYMVDESLIAHLKRTVGEELEEEFRKLLAYTDNEPNLSSEQKQAVIHAIYNCKILDPACGSGAFPVGILQQMVHILSRLDPKNTQWKELLISNAVKETEEAFRNISKEERATVLEDIEQSFNEQLNRPDYARKLYLIENCIYGVDIQPIAIQISKLRFFISLVVDQKTTNKPEDNFGIRPLPNLEAKFVAADSLIPLEKDNSFPLFNTEEVKQLVGNLKTANHKIFSAKTVRTKRKYKKLVKELRQQITVTLQKTNSVGNNQAKKLEDWDMFNQNEVASFFDPEWMFGVSDGFDIVIGNPPYGANIDNLISIYDKLYPDTSKGYKEIFKYFFNRGVNLLNHEAILCYISPNTFLRQSRYSDLRTFLLKYNIIQLIDLGEHIFEGPVVPVSITLLTNKRTYKKAVKFADLTKDINTSNMSKLLHNFNYQLIPQSQWLHTDNNIFIENLRHTTDNEVMLDDILFMKDAGFKYQRKNVGLAQKGKSDLAERIFYFGNRKNEKDIPILTGKDINDYYHLESPLKKLKYDYVSKLKENESTYYNKKIMNEPIKLIWRQTAPFFKGTILKSNIFFGNTIQAGIIKDKYKNKISYEYLCGLLNSSYLRMIYDQFVKEEGRVFPQVKISKLKPLPIIIAEKKLQEEIEKLVNKVILLTKEEKDTSTFLEKIEKIVESIYDYNKKIK